MRPMRRLLSFDQANRRLQVSPNRLSRLQSLPSPLSSIQSSSPEFVSIIQSLLDLPSNNNLSIRMDVSTDENWNEPQSNIASRSRISPQTTVFYSCEAGEDTRQDVDKRGSEHKALEWIFVIGNFIVELSSIVFDQLSSQHNALFLPICMGMSFLALAICIFELLYKIRKERATWMWRNTVPWFYSPSDSSLALGSHAEIAGLVCAFGQCIVATTSYCLFVKTGNNPIKISIWAAIFAFCQLCSKLFKEFGQDNYLQNQDVSSTELTSSTW